MSLQNTGSYSQAVNDTRKAVNKSITSEGQWKTAAKSTREHFGSETAMREIKAQFIADAIMPELDKKHRDAMSKDLPRKGSADYVAYVGAHGAQAWETANQAKKDARSTADTYFNRIVKYAFPAEKADTDSTPKTLETRLTTLINDAIGKCEKAEAPSFDVNETLKHLRAALALVNPKPF